MWSIVRAARPLKGWRKVYRMCLEYGGVKMASEEVTS